MLNKTSDFYEEELEAAILSVSLLEPAMIIFMGGHVGGIVASVMLPMFEIANAVQQGAEANQ